jgi:hypothetical protein
MEYVAQQITNYTSSIAEDWDDYYDGTAYYADPINSAPTTNSMARDGNYYYRVISDNAGAGIAGFRPSYYENVKWMKWSVCKKHAMFDLRSATISESAKNYDIVVDFRQDGITTLAIGEFLASYIHVLNLSIGTSTYSGNVGDYVTDELGIYRKVLVAGIEPVFEEQYTTTLPESEIDKYVVDEYGVYYTVDTTTTITPITPISLGITNFTVIDPGGDNQKFYRHILPAAASEPTHVIGVTGGTQRIYEILGAQLFDYRQAYDGISDYYDYIYVPFQEMVTKTLKVDLPSVSHNIRVIFGKHSTTNTAKCGYLIGGTATYMGDTLYGVNLGFNSYSSKVANEFGETSIIKRGVQDLVDFETIIDSSRYSEVRYNLKNIYDEIVAFVLDESETSRYNNLITLGTIQNSSVLLENSKLITISWSIYETL